MYHPTTRLLTILELLQAHPRLSGPELAARLEVDVRTVRRYVTMLQDLGIPIEANIGRYGGYQLRPGFKLPPLMFTDDEVLALTLGLLVARRLGLALAAPAVEGVIAKVERVLPMGLRERVQAVYETLIVDLDAPDVAVDSAILGTLSQAVQHSRQVWLRYCARDSVETERAIDPYGVAYCAGHWYVVGYCHLRKERRIFRLDRVRYAELRAATFIRPPHFDLAAYLLESFAAIPDRWDVEVLLTLSLEEARRRMPPALARLERHPDGVLLHASIDDLDWMARVLVGLNCPMVVHRPPELRTAFRRLAHELAALAVEPATDNGQSTPDQAALP